MVLMSLPVKKEPGRHSVLMAPHSNIPIQKVDNLFFIKGDGVVPIEKRYKITTKSTNATITAHSK